MPTGHSLLLSAAHAALRQLLWAAHCEQSIVPQCSSPQCEFCVCSHCGRYVSRIFYDCLVHWTGAGPAESFSAKRPDYKKYQESTRCFFPFEMPFWNHFREAGWPHTLS